MRELPTKSPNTHMMNFEVMERISQYDVQKPIYSFECLRLACLEHKHKALQKKSKKRMRRSLDIVVLCTPSSLRIIYQMPAWAWAYVWHYNWANTNDRPPAVTRSETTSYLTQANFLFCDSIFVWFLHTNTISIFSVIHVVDLILRFRLSNPSKMSLFIKPRFCF